jgi:hypothetical protein
MRNIPYLWCGAVVLCHCDEMSFAVRAVAE